VSPRHGPTTHVIDDVFGTVRGLNLEVASTATLHQDGGSEECQNVTWFIEGIETTVAFRRGGCSSCNNNGNSNNRFYHRCMCIE